jgi:hypothetical protein
MIFFDVGGSSISFDTKTKYLLAIYLTPAVAILGTLMLKKARPLIVPIESGKAQLFC